MWALVSTDDMGRRVVFPLTKVRTSIGRDPGCDIVLPDPNVSRQHAKVYVVDGKVEIKDMDSRNGIYVNNRRIESMTPLAAGQEVIIGSNLFHLEEEKVEERTGDMTTFRTIDQLREEKGFLQHPAEGDGGMAEVHGGERTMISTPDQMLAGIYGKKIALAQYPSVEVIFGASRGEKYLLPPGSYTLGRDANNNIRIDDEKASSRHGKLEITDKSATYTDLGSTNGSILNNRLVVASPLRHKDVLVLGNTRLKFLDIRTARRVSVRMGDEESLDIHEKPARSLAPWIWAFVGAAAVVAVILWWVLSSSR